MTTVEVLKIKKIGADYIKLREGTREIRINFADDEAFSKEDSAAFFRPLQGNPGAILVDGPFFIAVDFWRDSCDGSLKVIPFNFTASVERS